LNIVRVQFASEQDEDHVDAEILHSWCAPLSFRHESEIGSRRRHNIFVKSPTSQQFGHGSCSAHVTIRSSPLPLLLSTIALQSILPPFNSTCNQLYALQRAVRIERAAPGHPARPPQLQRTSPLERASSRLPATLLCEPPGVYKSSGRTSKTGQSNSTVPADTTQSCPSPPPNSPL
jgi:hypothetical protein